MCSSDLKTCYMGYACLRGARMSLIADTGLYHRLCLESNLRQRVRPDIKDELFSDDRHVLTNIALREYSEADTGQWWQRMTSWS